MMAHETKLQARRTALWALACLPWVGHAQSPAAGVKVEGQTFDAVARVAGADLVLNGTGLRAVAWFKAFAAGLYLARPARSTQEATALPGPKRLQLRMLRELPAVEFNKAVHKGVSRNVTAFQLQALQQRLDQFGAQVDALGKLHAGDVVDLDHEPGEGTAMLLNGTLRGGRITGDDFFVALLLSFLGDRPYDKKLKAGLLGLTP
jgi:Chalcone isomerase-like